MSEAATETFEAVPPPTAESPAYLCHHCAQMYTGPKTEKPQCPICHRIDDGQQQLDQEWVRRRFEEAHIIEEIGRDYSEASPEARQQKVVEKTHEYRKDRAPVATDAATKEKTKVERKPKAKTPCDCGCGTETGGMFAPGHDARVYSAARKVLKGDMTRKEANETFTASALDYCLNKIKSGDHK